ncbi:MAG: C39 family peptidase [Candidatus Promineifilaceae bacterium]|nr:C39 family peptidase [Candidatus Promineifilaceae bacterium]
MSSRTKSIILVVAVLQLALVVGLFALPRVVQALPGRYLVRLQSHRLTSGVVELVTTPLPQALPVAEAGGRTAVAVVDAPEIPGLDEPDAMDISPVVAPAVSQPTATPTATPEQTTTLVEEAAAATATPPPATPTATPLPTFTPMPIPEQVTLDGLISIVQGFNNCGPANMVIALDYWGDETTQQEAASYLKPNEEDRNVSAWQISDYVNDFTSLRSTVHVGGDLDTVRRLVAAGFPVVIEKGYEPQSGTEGWYGHYLTVYGYDDARQEFYSRDTYLGPFNGRPRIDSYREFLHWWQHFNYTFYVIYPPNREAEVMAIIPDYLENEWSMWQYAADLSRSELEEDPENVFTLFNLGVALTRLGQNASAETVANYDESVNIAYYEEATEIFDQARALGLPPRTLYYEHRPLMAYYKVGRFQDVLDLTASLLETPGGKWVEEIYWYRGHALATVGALVEAREAYMKALEVNENFYPAQTSLDWVNSLLES